MVKRLFDDRDNYNDLAREVSREFCDLLDPFLKGLEERGISLRDVSVVLHGDVVAQVAAAMIRGGMRMRKAKGLE